MDAKVDKKIKKSKNKLIIVTLILLLAVFSIIMSQTKIFNVKKIVVQGNSEISKDKTVVASGIIVGENIFKVDIKNSKENLLLHPYIKAIEIKRELPDKIVIDISEREEIAAIAYLDSYVYIGFDGLILDILKEKKENEVPLVSGLAIEHPSIGSNIKYNKKNKKKSEDISKFIEIIAKKNIKTKTKSIVFNKTNDINIILNTGANVSFGDFDNMEYKVKFLIETLNDLEMKKIKPKNIYLDKSKDIIVELMSS